VQARTVIGLCERFGCLPSQLAAEDMSLVKMLKVLEIADGEEGSG
jgi:hypothetical protein